MKNELNKAHVVVDRTDKGVQLHFFLDGSPSCFTPHAMTPGQAREFAVALIQASDETWDWNEPERIECQEK